MIPTPQRLISCTTKPFSVHELIKVARKLMFILRLTSNRILHFGCVNPSCTIHKLDKMVHHLVATNIWIPRIQMDNQWLEDTHFYTLRQDMDGDENQLLLGT